jgi:surface antigen
MVISTSTLAYENPRFFDYRSGTPVGSFLELSFGWFKTLSDNQKDAYYQSIAHAVMYAENGQRVNWYREDASGFSVPVVTWPTGTGYCRRIYIEVIAYGVVKQKRLNACYDNSSSNWRWTPDK